MHTFMNNDIHIMHLIGKKKQMPKSDLLFMVLTTANITITIAHNYNRDLITFQNV